MAWEAATVALVEAELEESAQAQQVQALVGQLRCEAVPALALVAALGPHLTTESDAVRARAVALLAQVSRQGLPLTAWWGQSSS